MARGWESKSIEAQQETAATLPSEARRLSPEEATIFRQRQGLLLSRTAVQRRLETVQNFRQRQMLQRALAELDERLAQLTLRGPQDEDRDL
jgi:hypothetical protein